MVHFKLHSLDVEQINNFCNRSKFVCARVVQIDLSKVILMKWTAEEMSEWDEVKVAVIKGIWKNALPGVRSPTLTFTRRMLYQLS